MPDFRLAHTLQRSKLEFSHTVDELAYLVFSLLFEFLVCHLFVLFLLSLSVVFFYLWSFVVDRYEVPRVGILVPFVEVLLCVS